MAGMSDTRKSLSSLLIRNFNDVTLERQVRDPLYNTLGARLAPGPTSATHGTGVRRATGTVDGGLHFSGSTCARAAPESAWTERRPLAFRPHFHHAVPHFLHVRAVATCPWGAAHHTAERGALRTTRHSTSGLFLAFISVRVFLRRKAFPTRTAWPGLVVAPSVFQPLQPIRHFAKLRLKGSQFGT